MEKNQQGHIGQAAMAVIAAAKSPQTGSAQQCEPWRGEVPTLRLPSTAEEADRLKAWALSVPLRPEPCDPSAIAVQIDYMRAALPSRAVDEQDGMKRLAVYVRLLRPFSEAALAHMARRACEELDWFPSARWCVAAAQSYPAPAKARSTALALSQRYHQDRFVNWLRFLRAGPVDQAEIDAAPKRHQQIAEVQGLLRWDENNQRYQQINRTTSSEIEGMHHAQCA